jgi:mono/diheme cytochrome c family protein
MTLLLRRSLLATSTVTLMFIAWVLITQWASDGAAPSVDPNVPISARIERGAYLARAGNCAACHTARGGAPWAGGLALETPFGAVVSSNLTSDPDTGLGRWTFEDFWRAMHHGRARDGRMLYPAFPYPNFSLVSPEDAADLWAYLSSIPPVRQANSAHSLRWPYSTQAALAVWRTLFFRPQPFEPNPSRNAAWNRGAYLVNGLGHCNTCHGQRNALGASSPLAIAHEGTVMPQQRWRAPTLAGAVTAHNSDDTVQWLQSGISAQHSALGPMAEVVAGSTQHLSAVDLQAMSAFLQTLPTAPTSPASQGQRDASQMAWGAQLYADQCATCHGQQGEGMPGIYPALVNNRTITAPAVNSLVQVITKGGFPPGTTLNPRPYGMPAFDLSHAELAALTTWLRGTWGNKASPVSEVGVLLLR